MAEAINCNCHYCSRQKRNCPILKGDSEANGLNMDDVNDESKQKRIANQSKSNRNDQGYQRCSGRGVYRGRGGGAGEGRDCSGSAHYGRPCSLQRHIMHI